MIPTEALIGAPLTELQDDFKLVPQGILQNYLSDTSVDPSSGFIRTVALAELSRRKRIQDDSNASRQPNPANMPTVAQTLLSTPAIQPAQLDQPEQPPVNLAHGGIVAFNDGGSTDVRLDRGILSQLQEARNQAASAGDQAGIAAIDARIAELSAGRFDKAIEAPAEPSPAQAPTSRQSIYEIATKIGPQTAMYQAALPEYQKYLEDMQPTSIGEGERNRIQQEKFKELQGISAPYYAGMEKLLGEERESAKQPNVGMNALMAASLTMMGKGNVADKFREAGLAGLNYLNKAQAEEAAAKREARKGEMSLLQYRMATARGDVTAAQAHLDKYQQSKEKEQQFELDKRKNIMASQQKAAEEEGRTTRNITDELYRAEALKEQIKSREETARLQREANAAARAVAPKLDPRIVQISKLIEDRLATTDRQIAELSKNRYDAENIAKINRLEQDRARLEKEWARVLGYESPDAPAVAPTTPVTGGSSSAPRYKFTDIPSPR